MRLEFNPDNSALCAGEQLAANLRAGGIQSCLAT